MIAVLTPRSFGRVHRSNAGRGPACAGNTKCSPGGRLKMHYSAEGDRTGDSGGKEVRQVCQVANTVTSFIGGLGLRDAWPGRCDNPTKRQNDKATPVARLELVSRAGVTQGTGV